MYVKINLEQVNVKDFTNIKLPQLYLSLIFKKIKDKKYSYMFDYIRENYEISNQQIVSYLKKNFIIAKYPTCYILRFNDNIYFKNKKDPNLKLITLINLINDGNLDVRGTNIFTDVSKYINSNIGNIFRCVCFNELAKKAKE